jgi:hypothetical protein
MSLIIYCRLLFIVSYYLLSLIIPHIIYFDLLFIVNHFIDTHLFSLIRAGRRSRPAHYLVLLFIIFLLFSFKIFVFLLFVIVYH